ncbi:Metalloenzyme, LuxS/M16 peptidase-like protein [Hygrophoropsis aurantiaca]|uniref:Metalloenzyme, LuxS/M16 peptidase-like protein n=1 Tax=Hygrophoropsis aurantiaca TaxID=72124 RepID=A0ACB8AEY7_9AGAM|nr:Metalloenzyme, LuxS/M16 peptidase-like protein [Hygrophoropsis aurantiaca]
MAITKDWKPIERKGATPPYAVYAKTVKKPQMDDRDYRIIKLENGLHATVIHDSKADTAAASLDVAVGHLYDPDDMPGLAHFCEHLLFMGTEQFPKENEYSEFLAKNNGSSNAYTSTSNTNYHFHVSTSALPQALARFAAFFHCPLFAPSCTSRELNAVDSEHKKNHQADMWRIFQLNKSLTKDGHPWSKFGSGNRDSLSQAGKDLKAKGKLNGTDGLKVADTPVSVNGSLAPSPIPSRGASPSPSIASASSEVEADGGAVGRETRRRLVEWWSKEYCASRMNVCVVGKESLDELADLVSTLFSPIPNRGQDPVPMINDHPFGQNESGTLVSAETIMAFHAVEISFPLEYQPPFWKHKPADLISHFVGHEGPGSLHSYLKNKGWVTSLNSGPQALGRGFAMFKVTLHLTKDGFDNYRSVVLAVFKYLSLLRSSAFPAWVQSEQSKISQIRFRFSEKRRPESYAVWISEHMTWPVPPELVLAAPQLIWEWEQPEEGEREVKALLEKFTIDRGRVVLMAKKEEYERLSQAQEWQKEKWYGTGYRVERWQEAFTQQAQAPNDIVELYLPGPNEFIPSNLEVDKRDTSEPLKRPHLIRQTPLSTVWHKKDDQFWLPKANVVMEIRSPMANSSPRAAVLTRLFSELVGDALTEHSYDADLAGLSYNFGSHSLGLSVMLMGYNDKLSLLARHVVETVKNLQVRPERLEIMKEQIKRDWSNFFLSQSYRLSDYYGRYMLTEQQWTLEEKLPQVPSITADELQVHVRQLLSQASIRMLVTGNMYKDEAIKLSEMVEEVLQASPLSSDEVVDRALILPESSNYVWTAPVPNPNELNSSLTYYMHLGELTSPRARVIGSLLAQIMSEPAFNVLRTQEQLGYIVSCSAWHLAGSGHFGMRIVVQSEQPPSYLEGRVDAFLQGMKAQLEDMESDIFDEHKQGLQSKWREALKNLNEETNRYWAHIESGYLDFLRRYHDSDLLTNVTKEEVLAFFLSRVHPSSLSRSKLAIHLQSRKPRPPRISAAAIQAFEALVKAANSTIVLGEWRNTLDGESPVASEFVNYCQDVFQENALLPDVAQEIMEKIPTLMSQYPSRVDGRSDTVTHITDVKAFRSSLQVSQLPQPLVEWGDLPGSKL